MWAVFGIEGQRAWLTGLFADQADAAALQKERPNDCQVHQMGAPIWPVFVVQEEKGIDLLSRRRLETRLQDIRVKHIIAINGISKPAPINVYTFTGDWTAPETFDCLNQREHAHVDSDFLGIMEDEGNTEFAFGPLG